MLSHLMFFDVDFCKVVGLLFGFQIVIFRMRYYRFYFFFQAEDGIRDDLVTGVQTCALPILAGKTGTTNNADDVWFIGYTPTLLAGVWFGYDTPRPIAPHATGGHLAAPAWADFYLNGWREPATMTAHGRGGPPRLVFRVHDTITRMLVV